MNTKRIVIIVLSVVGALLLLLVTTVGWFATSGLRPPVQVAEPDYWPTDGWRSSTPEEQGYSSAKLARTLTAIQEKGTAIDSLMIVRNGYVVLDANFAPYDGSFVHNMASVTKSVMTTLIAIAADQGKLDLDAPMVSYFPDRKIANMDERKASLTVRQLTGMVNGMESLCFADDQGSLAVIRAGSDWVQAALDRPMVSDPGDEFCYDSPGSHILSAILHETTGVTALEFAQENLFAPLGIQDAIWDVDPQGYNRGWGDLYLTPESAAKIGYLWLHQGNWNGRQIVSQQWVLDSVKPQIRPVDHDYGYGYGWWINNSHYFAAGRGGQTIRVMPALNTVWVTTGGGFDIPEIDGLLGPLLWSSIRSRAADPEGQAALETTLAQLQQSVDRPAVVAAPEIAALVSGNRYECEDNPAGLGSLAMDFSDPDVARIEQMSFGKPVSWEVGLDGSYRLTDDGDALIGYWQSPDTFRLEIFDIGTQVFLIRFEGEALEVSAEGADLVINCEAAAQ